VQGSVGERVGARVGFFDVTIVGHGIGVDCILCVGFGVGNSVGSSVGCRVGLGVGLGVGVGGTVGG